MDDGTLFEIDEKLRRLIDIGGGAAVDGETGEVFDEAALDALQMARSDKIDGVIKAIKNYEAKANALAAESKAMKQRADVLGNRAKWLRGYLARHIDVGETFDGIGGAIRWRKSDAAVIDVPVEELPERFIKTTRSAMLEAIKKAIKAGEAVPGAHLEDRKNLIIK